MEDIPVKDVKTVLNMIKQGRRRKSRCISKMEIKIET